VAHLGAGVRRGLRGPQSILEVGCDEVRAPVPLLRPAVQHHGRPVDPSARWRGPLGADAAPAGPRGAWPMWAGERDRPTGAQVLSRMLAVERAVRALPSARLLMPAAERGAPVGARSRSPGPAKAHAAAGPRGQPAQQRTQVVVDHGQVLTLAMSPTRAAAHAKPEEPWALWPRPAAARAKLREQRALSSRPATNHARPAGARARLRIRAADHAAPGTPVAQSPSLAAARAEQAAPRELPPRTAAGSLGQGVPSPMTVGAHAEPPRAQAQFPGPAVAHAPRVEPLAQS
jgi:hypothetical protein